MVRDRGVAVEDQQLVGGQPHPHTAADEPGRHRILAAAHHDSTVPIYPRLQYQTRFEPLSRQWSQ